MQNPSAYVCSHCSGGGGSGHTASTISQVGETKPCSAQHSSPFTDLYTCPESYTAIEQQTNMSGGFTAVHSVNNNSNNSAAAMASSSKRGCNTANSDPKGTGEGAGSGSGGSFSRDNSGETMSGSDSTADHQHQHSHQHHTSTSRQHQQHQRSSSEHSGASHQTRDRPGSSSGGDRGERGGVDDFEGDDDVIDEGDGSCTEEKGHSCHSQRWQKAPESCSSYSSLNNDEDCDGDESLHSQEGEGGSQAFDLPSQFAAGRSGGGPGGYNYPRKYSLTVPGEPRHMRLLHRSGSRSPLNSSCGGLSPSELSTPSPSCSNSM